MRRALRIVVIAAAVGGAPLAATAQGLPSEPLRALGGRLVLTGEAVVTVATADNESYFNYTDYERNALRTVRLSLAALWQPADRLAFVGELLAEDFENAEAYAAYVRIRPWPAHKFDILAGRIPPVFGNFGRRRYNSDRMLIGYPLAYQYLTSLRSDALPATADDLLIMRARGWRSAFPVGDLGQGPGVPLISAFRWDTGVQTRWSTEFAETAVSVTTGTLSYPRVSDDNGSKQISGRFALLPTPGLVIGVSGARGGWVASDVPVTGSRDDLAQTALGADVEYSRDHWLVRGELVWSRWRLPFITTPPEGPTVKALGSWVEGRYRFSPRWYAAARLDRLGFSKITGSAFGGRSTPWDAPVRRFEAGAGYYVRRNVVARMTVQWNDRNAGRVHSKTFVAGQLGYWF